MEIPLFNLRQWIYRLRQRYHKKPKRVFTYSPGLPEGILLTTLETICAKHFNCSIASVSHLHLSGWKSSGAYRLVVRSTAGHEYLLIYKNAYYADESIPALVNLPVKPGPSEYEIYRQVNGELANYLPNIYQAEEVIPGRHYRYILEDLRPDYRIMRDEEDKVLVGSLLPELHCALQTWAQTADTRHFITYGRSFSEALQKYALHNLQQYYQKNESSDLKSVLAQWPGITRIHLEPEFFASPLLPIHGDSNYSNIHLNREDPNRFKVVDWEWAGFGSPYADLTSMLQGARFDIEKQAFTRFINASSMQKSAIDKKQEYRRFLWSSLERCMLDAAFLAAQKMNSLTKARINLDTAISRSLLKLLMVYRQMS